jgi:hypothetical protein
MKKTYCRKCESSIYFLPTISMQTIISNGKSQKTLYFTFLKYEIAIILN